MTSDMANIPSQQADSRLAVEEIRCLSWSPGFLGRVFSSLPPYPVMTYLNIFGVFVLCLSQICLHINVILPLPSGSF